MLAVLLVALAWRVIERTTAHPNLWLGYALAAGAAVAFAGASRSRRTAPAWRAPWLPLGVAGGACILAASAVLAISSSGVSKPVYAGCSLLGAGILGARFCRRRWVGCLAWLNVLAVVVVITGASTVALTEVAWRFHDIPISLRLPDLWSAPVRGAHGLADLAAGSPTLTDISEGVVKVWTGDRLAEVRLTFEALGLYELWYIGVAFAAFAAMRTKGPSVRSLVGNVAITGAYTLLRFVLLTVIALEFDRSQVFWHPGYAVLSWLPLGLVLGCGALPRQIRSERRPAGPPGSRQDRPPGCPEESRCPTRSARPGAGRASVAAFVAGSVIAFSIGFDDPGQLKPGRVLIDETHANWEWTDEPFDTTSFGIRAEYNYCCLKAYLSHFYDVNTTTSISEAALDTTDVLVIKTPTEAYDVAEIDAIERYVARGGGLLIIGDHTNLFGMSGYLNAITRRFGIALRYDDTFDVATRGLSAYERPGLLPHPALRGLERFEFLTSCTVVGDIRTRAVIVGCGLASEDVDYGHPNFFGNIRYDLCDRFGVFAQAAARRSGKGRVLIFTDSTCFSNFCMFSPGKPEMALGFVDYLSRQGARYPGARPLGIVLSVALLGISGLRALRADRTRAARYIRTIMPAVWAGLIVGGAAAARINAALYGPIALRTPIPIILYETAHSDATFFDYLVPSPLGDEHQFEQFYLCAQRLGACPDAGPAAALLTRRPQALVIINPSKPFSTKELSLIQSYLEDGGRLLLMDSVTNGRSTANQILARFGLGLSVRVRATRAEDEAGTSYPPSLVLHSIGPAQMVARDGGTVAVLNVGKGKIVVATDAFCFSAAVLGRALQATRPSADAREAYRRAFALYETLLSSGCPHDGLR